MKLLNLTPHDVVLRGIKIASSGQQARVETTRKLGRYTVVNDRPVPVFHTILGAVTGLPEAAKGVGYIVSALVRSAAPDRRDLYSPADLQRDERGNVIGCESLDQNP